MRHGATEWSESGRHTSRTDLPLLPSGARAAKALRLLLADVLSARRPGLVLVSPRQRAQQTAAGAGLLLGDVPVETDPDLAEVDYGEYEGLTTPQIREQVPGWSVWTHAMPAGESMESAGERADRVLARARAVAAAAPVVLVGHGHFSRVLGARWLDLPASDGRLLALGTGGVSVLGLEREQPVLLRWNLPNPALPRT